MKDALHFAHRFEPPGAPDAPTLLLLHGTGGDENDLMPLGRLLAAEAALLSPRGRVSENGSPRFFRRLAEGVFDMDDLVARAAELADFVGEATAHYGLDPTRVVAAGFSNGANIAAAVLLLHPTVLRGGLLFAPMVPIEPDQRPDLSGVGVFLGAGREDPIAPAEQAERLATLLAEAGAAVELSWHPGGHQLVRDQVDEGRAWLTKLLAATASDGGRSLP